MPRSPALEIARVSNGPIRAVFTVGYDSWWLKLLKPAVRNRVVGASIGHACQWWIDNYLPLRFSGMVRRSPFSYVASKKYERRKAKMAGKPLLVKDRGGKTLITVDSPQPTPLVFSGRSRSKALETARYTVPRNAATRMAAIIRFAMGWAGIRGARILKTLPEGEIRSMARIMQEELPRQIASNAPKSIQRRAGSFAKRKVG